jgi:hypothetical protein
MSDRDDSPFRRYIQGKGRVYTWPDRTVTSDPEYIFPSVTAIVGQKDKPALKHWAANSVAAFAVDHRDEWLSLDRDAAYKALRSAPFNQSDTAKTRGTNVHKAIERAILAEDLTTIDDLDLLPFVAAGWRFIQDNVRKLLYTEAHLFNQTWRYAGQADLLAVLNDGRIAYIDWKTGKDLYADYVIQVAGGYMQAEWVGVIGSTDKVTPPPADVGILVLLTDDATYRAREIPSDVVPQAVKAFQGLRSVAKWEEQYADHALGLELRGDAKEVMATVSA